MAALHSARPSDRAEARSVHGGGRLQARFSLLVVGVVIAACALYLIWTSVAQGQATESKALSEARTLNTEMMAVWDYIDASQTAINYNSDGRYDFKGIYCSVAGKAIARRFTARSEGYIVRYARENPARAVMSPTSLRRPLCAVSNKARSSTTASIQWMGRAIFAMSQRLPTRSDA